MVRVLCWKFVFQFTLTQIIVVPCLYRILVTDRWIGPLSHLSYRILNNKCVFTKNIKPVVSLYNNKNTLDLHLSASMIVCIFFWLLSKTIQGKSLHVFLLPHIVWGKIAWAGNWDGLYNMVVRQQWLQHYNIGLVLL